MVQSKQSMNVEECIENLRGRVIAKAPSEVVLADSDLRAQIINDCLNDLDSSWYIIKVSCIGEKSILDLLKAVALQVYQLQKALKNNSSFQDEKYKKVQKALSRRYEDFKEVDNRDYYDNGLQNYVKYLLEKYNINCILLLEDFDVISETFYREDYLTLRPYTDIFVVIVSSCFSIKSMEEKASGSAYVFNQFKSFPEEIIE